MTMIKSSSGLRGVVRMVPPSALSSFQRGFGSFSRLRPSDF